MDYKLINIIGIDGAGKTTLAHNLTSFLKKKNDRLQYQYCQYFAKLLLPMKIAAKLTLMRKTDEFKNYTNYNKTKQKLSSRFKPIANLYATVWVIDYFLQITFKVTIPMLFGKAFIIDRYIVDIAVNLSLTTNNDVHYACKIISYFYKVAPKPDKTIFIDLPEDVAFNRKKDIQSIEYLKERRARYIYLSQKYNFLIVNGQKNAQEMLKDTLNLLNI